MQCRTLDRRVDSIRAYYEHELQDVRYSCVYFDILYVTYILVLFMR